MAVSTFTPIFHITPNESNSLSFSSRFKLPRTKLKPNFTKAKVFATLSDPFVLQIAETLEDSHSSSPPHLQKLRDFSSESLLSTRWPSRKDEPFRFTDTSFIKKSQIIPISTPPPPPPQSLHLFDDSEETQFPNLVIVDGYIADSVSNLSGLPDGVFVGSLSNLDSEVIKKRVLDFVSSNDGDLFWSLNGIGAPDLVVVYVPEGCVVETPLHLRYFSDKGEDKESNKLPVSNPRLLVLVEKGGEIGIIEEYVGEVDKCYWTNSVMEVVVGDGAKLIHSYIQNQSLQAAHIKWTSVRQVMYLCNFFQLL